MWSYTQRSTEIPGLYKIYSCLDPARIDSIVEIVAQADEGKEVLDHAQRRI
jgi:hypothetical protein